MKSDAESVQSLTGLRYSLIYLLTSYFLSIIIIIIIKISSHLEEIITQGLSLYIYIYVYIHVYYILL